MTKLGLGGHSFIEELGNDPMASFQEQSAIVNACRENGMRWIDTTYYQERVALGKLLSSKALRPELFITAWNFFRQPGRENQLVGSTTYCPNSLSEQLQELQTDYVDLLVIHRSDNSADFLAELEMAKQWRDAGLIRAIGLGMARAGDITGLPEGHPISHVLAPYNAFDTRAVDLFREAKTAGITTVAMSPFTRGWNLDKLGGDRKTLASLLLRWVTSQDIVDIVFLAMRRLEWVVANREAEDQGLLSEGESEIVRECVARLR